MKLIFTFLILWFSVELMAQKAGTLDSSFGVNGKTITGKINYFPEPNCSAAMSDGSIVVGGTITTNTLFGGFFASKYSRDGVFDTAFGKKGIALIRNLQYAEAIAVQPDNKIVMCGYGIGGGQSYFICIGRLNPDGSIDTTFGKHGTIITDDGESSNDIAIQPDGKILIAGSTRSSFLIFRYLPNGNLDSSFGGNGKARTDFGLARADAISVLPNGKILVFGTDAGNNVLVRYRPNGRLDSSFGLNGIASFYRDDERGLNIEGFNDMILQPDGKILVAGAKADLALQVDSILIRRFKSNGDADSSFGNNGRVVSNFGYSCIATRIAVEKEGNIVTAGDVTDLVYTHHFLVERYKPNGSPDLLFGNNGHQVTKMGEADGASGLIIQDDGRIVLTGYAENDSMVPTADGIALARYNNGNYQIHSYAQQNNKFKIAQHSYIIYPNPAQNILHVDGLSSTQTKLTVVDFNCNIKLQVVANTSSYNLNIASLHAGNYLLKIETNDEVVTRQFVKE